MRFPRPDFHRLTSLIRTTHHGRVWSWTFSSIINNNGYPSTTSLKIIICSHTLHGSMTSLYISKSWSIVFIIVTLLLSHISGHIIHQFLTFSLIFFFNFFFLLLISQLNVILSLTFLPFLSFHLPTTNYLNITFPQSFYLPLFLAFSYSPSYYKFTILNFILYIVFPHT